MIVNSRCRPGRRCRTSSTLSSFVSCPSTPTTRARSTGISWTRLAPFAGSARNARNAVHLAALHVEQEHVGRVGRRLHRELVEQARLQRPDADDEEGAEADGEQDHARLVAGPRKVQHRMPQRKRLRVSRAATTALTSPRPARCSTTRERGEAERRRRRPTRSDAACQAVIATSAAETSTIAADLRPVEPARCGRFVAQQQRRLDEADVQQRHDRKQQRDQHADRDALRRRAPAVTP